jgi:monoamine oxidase
MADCCVIGAGLAGLTAADALARAGVQVTVLEARPRVGGRVWSKRLAGGALVERAGEFITAGYTATEALADRLSLTLDGMGIRYPDRALRPDPGIDRATAFATAHAVEAAATTSPDEAATALLQRVVADPALRELFASRVQSATSYPIDLLPAAHLVDVAHLLSDVETRRVRGGNDRLALALAAPLGDAVHLSDPVHRIRHGADGVDIDAAGGTLRADACIIAVPLPIVADIRIEPALSPAHRAWIASIAMGKAAKLALPLTAPVAPEAIMSTPHRFWAYTTSCDEVGGRSVGSWAGSAPVVDFLGARDGMERWLEHLRELWPEVPLGDPAEGCLTRWVEAAWTGGSYSVIGAMPDGRERHPVGDASGRLAFAGEHTAEAPWTATIEGAIRSGHRAAQDVLDMLAPLTPKPLRYR